MVNVEAMACGIPVVATQVGGIPEVFTGGGALLVPPNSSDQLASALDSLVKNPILRRDIGRDGYKSFMRNFSWSRVYERYLKVLLSITSKRPAEHKDLTVTTC
jgi:glycosyltransferase involved in cell wall biosynthesis